VFAGALVPDIGRNGSFWPVSARLPQAGLF
jgi:hypothetical protein